MTRNEELGVLVDAYDKDIIDKTSICITDMMTSRMIARQTVDFMFELVEKMQSVGLVESGYKTSKAVVMMIENAVNFADKELHQHE